MGFVEYIVLCVDVHDTVFQGESPPVLAPCYLQYVDWWMNTWSC